MASKTRKPWHPKAASQEPSPASVANVVSAPPSTEPVETIAPPPEVVTISEDLNAVEVVTEVAAQPVSEVIVETKTEVAPMPPRVTVAPTPGPAPVVLSPEEQLGAFRQECKSMAAADGNYLIGQPCFAETKPRMGRGGFEQALPYQVKLNVAAYGEGTMIQRVDGEKGAYEIIRRTNGRIVRRMALPQGLEEAEWIDGEWKFYFVDVDKKQNTGWKPLKEYSKWK